MWFMSASVKGNRLLWVTPSLNAEGGKSAGNSERIPLHLQVPGEHPVAFKEGHLSPSFAWHMIRLVRRTGLLCTNWKGNSAQQIWLSWALFCQSTRWWWWWWLWCWWRSIGQAPLNNCTLEIVLLSVPGIPGDKIWDWCILNPKPHLVVSTKRDPGPVYPECSNAYNEGHLKKLHFPQILLLIPQNKVMCFDKKWGLGFYSTLFESKNNLISPLASNWNMKLMLFYDKDERYDVASHIHHFRAISVNIIWLRRSPVASNTSKSCRRWGWAASKKILLTCSLSASACSVFPFLWWG